MLKKKKKNGIRNSPSDNLLVYSVCFVYVFYENGQQ
jgi:hypothetical protein